MKTRSIKDLKLIMNNFVLYVSSHFIKLGNNLKKIDHYSTSFEV